jgi:hypothetical protein
MKSRFIYYLFEAFFVHDKTIGEIDIHMLIRKTGDHDNITGDHR